MVNAMLVGRYRLVPGAGATAKKDPRSLGLALTFDGAPELQYLDDKRMGKVYVARAADEQSIPIYGQLGADVLSPAFTRDAFGALIARRRDQVRAFLMDKRALASIGNAYADEILFAAGIHPKTFCKKLAPADIDALHAAIGRVLADAIAEIRRRDEPIEVKVRDFSRCAAATASRASSAARPSARCASATATPASAPTASARRASCSSTGRGSTMRRPLHQRPQKNRAGRRDVERIGARRHRDGDQVVAALARRGRQARPFGAQQQGEARGRRKARQRRRARLHHRPDDLAGRRRAAPPGRRARSGRARQAEGNRAQRDADRLAIERDPRSAGTAPARPLRTRRRGARAPPGCRRRSDPRPPPARARRAAAARAPGAPDREAAAVNVKAGDGVQHGLRRDEDGNAPVSASASVASRGGVSSTECTVRLLLTSRRTTRSLSATKRPPSAFRCLSLSCR